MVSGWPHLKCNRLYCWSITSQCHRHDIIIILNLTVSTLFLISISNSIFKEFFLEDIGVELLLSFSFLQRELGLEEIIASVRPGDVGALWHVKIVVELLLWRIKAYIYLSYSLLGIATALFACLIVCWVKKLFGAWSMIMCHKTKRAPKK